MISKVRLNVVRKTIGGIPVTQEGDIIASEAMEMMLRDNFISIKTAERQICIPLSMVLWFEPDIAAIKEKVSEAVGRMDKRRKGRK